jgi:DNA processing protein
VFAVPGSIESFKSSGTHRLIKQGAKLVEHAQDVLDEIGQPRAEVLMPEPDEQKAPWSPALNPDQKRVWDLLSGDPLHVDQIVRESRLGIAPLLSLLLEMELQGWIQQLPGKYFIRKPL